jgi:hypothetical protein
MDLSGLKGVKKGKKPSLRENQLIGIYYRKYIGLAGGS